MSTAAFVRFFAVLSLLTWAGTLTMIGLAVLHRRNPESSAGYLFEDIAARTRCGSRSWSRWSRCSAACTSPRSRTSSRARCAGTSASACTRSRSRCSSAGCAATAWCGPTSCRPPIIGTGIAIYHTQLQAFPEAARPVLQDRRPVHGSLRVGVRLRVDPVHGTRSFRVHHHHDVGRCAPNRPKKTTSNSNPPTRPTPRTRSPFPRKESHEQAAQSPVVEATTAGAQGAHGRRGQDREEGNRPHRVDHRRRS